VTLGNGLNLRAHICNGAMARLLLLGLVALLESACLIPQDDPVLPELPPKKNSPLRVLAQTMKPAQRRTTVLVGMLGPSCPRPEFSLTVADDDTGDPIRSQWYVNPRPDYQPTANNPVFSGATIFGGTAVNRTVTAPNAMLTYLDSLNRNEEHLIEVWVTDGEFDPNAPPTQASRPDRTLPDGTVVADPPSTGFNVWVVKVVNCP
jgi:hypothetical protein